MATTFTEIAGLIRKVVGDHNDRRYQFSTDAIYDHVRLAILEINSSTIAEDTEAFTTDLSNEDKLRVIMMAARSLISPVPNEFSYRTPVHAVRRKGQTMQILARIEDALAASNGGYTAVVTDTFLRSLFQGPDDLADEIAESI